MKKVRFLLVLACVVIAGIVLYACNKIDQYNPDSPQARADLGRQMSEDPLVQEYFAITRKQTHDLIRGIRNGLQFDQAHATASLAKVTSDAQTDLLAELGQQISQKYGISKMDNIAAHEVLNAVLDQISHMPHAVLTGKPSLHTSASTSKSSYGSYAGYTNTGCTDWYLVTVNVATGEVVSETYLYTTCDQNQAPQPGEGGSASIADNPWIPLPVTCEQEKEIKVIRCDRNAQSTLVWAGIGAALVTTISGGTLSPGAAAGLGVAIAKAATDLVNCLHDADEDYRICVEKRKYHNGEPVGPQ